MFLVLCVDEQWSEIMSFCSKKTISARQLHPLKARAGRSALINIQITDRGSATNRTGGAIPPPQFLEKINEFLKFTIHF